MPTVVRKGRLRIVIYPADHRPAHGHAIGPDGEAVFNFNCAHGPCALRENYGMPSRSLTRAEKLINQKLVELCRAWEKLHGNA